VRIADAERTDIGSLVRRAVVRHFLILPDGDGIKNSKE
jgi:hypothetical protein